MEQLANEFEKSTLHAQEETFGSRWVSRTTGPQGGGVGRTPGTKPLLTTYPGMHGNLTRLTEKQAEGSSQRLGAQASQSPCAVPRKEKSTNTIVSQQKNTAGGN